MTRGDHREAAARLDEALSVLGRPAERALIEAAIDIRLYLRAALLPLGDEARVLRLLREAESLATEIADTPRLGRIADSLSFHHWLRGEPAEAAREGRRALDLAEASGDATLAIIANHHLGLASYTRGDYPAAIAAFRRTIAALTGDLAHARLGLVNPPAITARSYLTWCLGEVGEFAEAVAIGQDALRTAEALGPPVGILAAARGLASVWVRQGELGRARPLLERGLALCRAGGVDLYLASFHLVPRVRARAGGGIRGGAAAPGGSGAPRGGDARDRRARAPRGLARRRPADGAPGGRGGDAR